MPTMTPATANSGTPTAALADQAPLYCSETLACSDSLDCADNGAVPAPTSTGTMVAA